MELFCNRWNVISIKIKLEGKAIIISALLTKKKKNSTGVLVFKLRTSTEQKNVTNS